MGGREQEPAGEGSRGPRWEGQNQDRHGTGPLSRKRHLASLGTGQPPGGRGLAKRQLPPYLPPASPSSWKDRPCGELGLSSARLTLASLFFRSLTQAFILTAHFVPGFWPQRQSPAPLAQPLCWPVPPPAWLSQWEGRCPWGWRNGGGRGGEDPTLSNSERSWCSQEV